MSRGGRLVRPAPTKQWVLQGLFEEHAPRRSRHLVEAVPSPAIIGRRGAPGGGGDHRIELDDPHVSGAHAIVSPAADGLRVQDRRSRNGIWLDQERVEECVLRPGALLRVGRSLFTCGVLEELEEQHSADGLLGGACFREVRDALNSSAGSALHVVVLGGPGSGKRAFARALAGRQMRTWAEFDPSRIPPRLLEVELFGNQRVRGALRSAGEGALYVTRSDKLSSSQLDRLVLEANTFGTRLLFGVAGGSSLLQQAALGGALRVALPGLEQRRPDIPLLVSSVIPRGLIGIQVEFVEACYFESWPGNVGQLLRTVRDAVARAVAEREGAVAPRHLLKAEPGGHE